MKKRLGSILAVLAAALFLVYAYSPKPPGAEEKARVEAVLRASLADLDGKQQALSQWRGKVLIVNFWAPWCPPCRMEMPGFIDLQEKYRKQGLVFVGIAIDSPDKVREFARKVGVNYPVLVDQNSSVLDVSGLPYTAVFDRKGEVVDTHTGALPKEELEDIIGKLL